MMQHSTLLLLTSEFPPRRGGIGAYAVNLAQAAAEIGYKVTVAAADYYEDQTSLDQTYPFETIRFSGQQHSMKHLANKIAFVHKLAKNRSFDIVHAADWPFYIPLALSRYRKESRCLLTFHGSEVAFMQQKRRSWLLQILKFWDGWAEYIANSNYTANSLCTAFGLPEGQARPIGLGVSRKWLDYKVDKQAARSRHDIGEERFVIVSVGRIVPRKGLHVIAEALKNLPTSVSNNLTWLIIGPKNDTNYESELRHLVSKLPIDIRIMGSIDDVELLSIMSTADLFCLPGLIDSNGGVEGFGLVYLEAAALGVPSLATRVGGVPDAVIDGHTGFLCEPNNAREVSDQIANLFMNRDQLATLARNARLHAADQTWSSVALQTYGPPRS